MDDYLLIGKTRASLDKPSELPRRDALVANEDRPCLKLQNKSTQRAIWVNVSLKQAKFDKCDFSHTIFINCYFRGARFRDCNFTGCRFIDCNFQSSTIHRCNLQYSRWEKTDIARSTLLENLPAEPNLAQKLLIQLRLNASSIGEYDDARYYLYEAEERSREHFVEIIKCRKDYYRDKYSISLDRIIAPFRYVGSLLNKVLWGYGERPLVLSRNGLLLILGFGIIHSYTDDSMDISSGIKLSLGAFVSALPGVDPATSDVSFWLLIESLFGIVYIALLAASLHRRISTRRD